MEKDKLNFFEKLNNWIKQSITIRLITIGILILLLLIPIAMVESLISERENRKDEAIKEVSSKWGEQQTVKGIVLTIPYKTYTKVFEGDKTDKFKLVESIGYAHFLPEMLDIQGEIKPEIRYRGIYEVIVYNARLNLKGSFSKPSFKEWKTDNSDIMWDDAYLSLGLSDLRSIQEDISINWNDKKFPFNPGVESNDVIQTGISAKFPSGSIDSLGGNSEFSLSLNFNGSSGLYFIPLGKTTKVNLNSKWENPSFDGAFLPDKRDVTNNGFKAMWNVLHLNRSYPQQFKGSVKGIDESSFGVNLFMPVDEYQKSMRSAKYASMFIALTFFVFFFVQILNKVKIHPIQYIIVGLALCVFYTLLIALSEHLTFKYGYLIASVSVICLITLYAKSIFSKKILFRLIFLILTSLYLFIYTLIQMEDYALLMGSIGLFLVLATLMFLSRKINWYEIKTSGEE
ncbi:MAG: cell envelope integrity protein CreD [Bacteroidota bacterium]|jgi:inner membrane protein